MTAVSRVVYLLELDVWNGSAIETWRFSTKTISTRPTDVPPNAVYRGAILDAGQIDRQFGFSNAEVSASYSPISLRLDNLKNDFTPLLNPDSAYAVDGRAFRLKYISAPDLGAASATTIINGTARGLDASDALRSVLLLGSDKMAALRRPLLTARYGGTSTSAGATADGDVNMLGQTKPVVFGVTPNVLPKIVNPYSLIYQVSILPVSSIVVYDGGLPLENLGDFPSISAMLAAPGLVAGKFATCLALGLFCIGGDPEQVITADVIEGTSASVRSAARVCQRMLSLFGIASSDILSSSFDAFHAFNSAEVGIYVEDQSDFSGLLSQVAGSVMGAIIPSEAGLYQAVWMQDPATASPSDTFTLRDIGSEGASFGFLLGADEDNTGIPGWRVSVNWGHNWHIMSGGDLLGNVDAATRALLTDPSGYRVALPSGAYDASVLTAHPLALDFIVNTLLVRPTDANAQAIARFGLVRRKRAKIVAPVNFDRAAPTMGSIIRIKDAGHPLFAAGRNYLVMGRRDDMTRRTRLLKLWG